MQTFLSVSITRAAAVLGVVLWGCSPAPYPKTLESTIPLATTSEWQRDLGRAIETPPVVKGDRVYVAVTDKKALCLDVATGKTLWSRTLEGAPFVGPILSDSVVVVATGYPKPHVQALDAETGKPLWKKQTHVTSVVALGGDYVLLGFDDGTTERVDARTGEVMWSRGYGARWCSPAVYDPGRQHVFVPLDPDSMVILESVSGKVRGGTNALISPVLSHVYNELLILDSMGNFEVRDTETLALITSETLGGAPAGLPYADGSMVAVSLRSGTVLGLARRDWSLEWLQTFPSPLTSGPVMAAGRVYQALPRGEVVILDALSGREIDRLQHPERLLAPPAVTAQYLLVPGSHGTLAAYKLPEHRSPSLIGR